MYRDYQSADFHDQRVVHLQQRARGRSNGKEFYGSAMTTVGEFKDQARFLVKSSAYILWTSFFLVEAELTNEASPPTSAFALLKRCDRKFLRTPHTSPFIG